jgi:hypothetical protein
MSMVDRSKTERSFSGKRGATMYENANPSSASMLTEHTVPMPTDSMSLVMDARTSCKGALLVSCSNTSRSAAATRSVRLRSEISAMLPRTNR